MRLSTARLVAYALPSLVSSFDGPPLMPQDPKARARVNQITGLLDNYAYRAMVWDVFVERISVPGEGGVSDEAKIAAGLRTAETCLATLADLMGEGDCLVGSDITLADLHTAPMIALFRQTPEGADALSGYPSLTKWWARLAERPSLKAVLD